MSEGISAIGNPAYVSTTPVPSVSGFWANPGTKLPAPFKPLGITPVSAKIFVY